MKTWLNGSLVDDADAVISVSDHGLTVGDGVFETLRTYGGRAFAVRRHLLRLATSALGMGLASPPPDVVRAAIDAVLAANDRDEAVVRVTLTSGPGPLGSARAALPADLASWWSGAAAGGAAAAADSTAGGAATAGGVAAARGGAGGGGGAAAADSTAGEAAGGEAAGRGGAGGGGHPSGSGPTGGPGPTLIVTGRPLPPQPPSVGVAVAPWPRNERSPLAGLKTTSYGENVVALAWARARGADEALLANLAGDLCEGTGTNVIVAVRDRLVTPPLRSGCLAGVTRALVLEACGVIEDDLPVSALTDADEAFLTSSTREVQAINAVDGRALPRAPGPLTSAAAAAFAILAAADIDP